MKKNILLIAVLLTTMFISGCGQIKVGYVDGEKLMDAPQIKVIRDEGETKLQEAQEAAMADLTAKQEASDEEKQKAQMDAQRKLIGIQQAYSTQIRQKLDAALSGIAKEKGLDVVVDSSEDLKIVVEGGVDLTDEVIQKLQ